MKRFTDWQQPSFDETGMTQWNWMCQYHENLVIGANSDVGAFTYINAKHGVVIEEEVQIGSHCAIYSDNTIDGTSGRVVIKKGAKIGSHTIILPGVTIGEGAKIGAHSLIKSDIPAKTVYAGIPAKPLSQ